MLLAVFAGFLVGDFGWYLVHRLQHNGGIRAKAHGLHHMENEARGWLREFWAYIVPASTPIAAIAIACWWLLSAEVAVGWCLGITGYIAFCSYVHELYHTDPNLVFWLKRPVHYFHHANNERGTNFGLVHPLWDRLLSTYQDDPAWRPTKVPLWKVLTVRWI